MKTTAAFLLFCLLIVDVRGQARDMLRRCLCSDAGLKMVRLNRVEKIEIFPPSPSCEKEELIVTLKDGAGKKCLNPESTFVKNLVKKMMPKRNQP